MFNAPVDWLPLKPRLPDQSPLATHDVALAVVQFIVDDPPRTMADGAAVSVTVGGGVAGVTVTLTLRVVVPPEPVQASVNVVDCESADVVCEPEIALAPLQPPEAVHVDALVADHDKVDVPPRAICAGFADSETLGAGGVALTTTVADRDATPPGPVQLSP